MALNLTSTKPSTSLRIGAKAPAPAAPQRPSRVAVQAVMAEQAKPLRVGINGE
jgi:hypothetical protein